MKKILLTILTAASHFSFAQTGCLVYKHAEQGSYKIEYCKTSGKLTLKLFAGSTVVQQAMDYYDLGMQEDIDAIDVHIQKAEGKTTAVAVYEILKDGLDDGIVKMIIFQEHAKIVLVGNYAKQSEADKQVRVIIKSKPNDVSTGSLRSYTNYLEQLCLKKSKKIIKELEG